MIGILLISHGEFAQGMLASSHLFENGQYLSLKNIDLNSLRAIGAEGVCNLEEKL